MMNKEILKRFFEGRSSVWEKKQVQEYLEGNDLDVFDEYLKDQAEIDSQPQVDKEYKYDFFNELTSRIDKQEHSGKTAKMLNFTPLLKIAAGILLISSIGGILYLNRQSQREMEIKTRLTSISNHGRNLKLIELKDGTRIWMNPGTTISYNESSFGDISRQVTITGEAYFNVAHDVTKPFRVKAGKLMTTVLGTSFNVEAYENEPEMRVMLVTGRIRVNAGKTEKTLAPGQMLDYSKYSETVKVNPVDVSDKQKQFTDGRLVFENLPLRDVLKRLERVFNLQITVSNTDLLRNKRISGSYYRDHAESALERILFIHGLQHHKKGENNYVITE